MKHEISFAELDQLATDHLEAMLGRDQLSDENRMRIAYEIDTRNINLPEDWK